jgi:hypothetical protein
VARIQVGSNQYHTRLITDVPTELGHDLIAQAGVADTAERLRCGEVWGTACRAWVRGPNWSHGSHPASPDVLQSIACPDRTIDVVGTAQLSKSQLFHLACNPHLQPATMLRLLNDPYGQAVYQRNNMLLGSCVKHWDADQVYELIKQWPPQLPPERYLSVSVPLLLSLDSAFLWRLIQDSRWGKQALRRLQNSRINDPELFRAVWVYTKEHGTVDELKNLVINNDRNIPLDLVHEILADDNLGCFDVWHLVDEHHKHLTDAELQHVALTFPNNASVVSAVFYAVRDRPAGQDLRWLWEASDWLRGSGVFSWASYKTARDILLSPGMPAAAHLHYVSKVVSQVKNPSAALSYLDGDPPIPATAISAAYADASIRATMTIDARERLVRLPQCPTDIIAQEARSQSPRVAVAAARHPNCPSQLVVRALSMVTPGDRIHKELLRHPNMPEEYRVLSQL